MILSQLATYASLHILFRLIPGYPNLRFLYWDIPGYPDLPRVSFFQMIDLCGFQVFRHGHGGRRGRALHLKLCIFLARVILFLCGHGKGRRDLSAEHSTRLSVGYGGPTRGQAQNFGRSCDDSEPPRQSPSPSQRRDPPGPRRLREIVT